jgi:hypothetical protein
LEIYHLQMLTTWAWQADLLWATSFYTNN